MKNIKKKYAVKVENTTDNSELTKRINKQNV